MGMGIDGKYRISYYSTTELVTMENAIVLLYFTSHNPTQWNAIKLLNEKENF